MTKTWTLVVPWVGCGGALEVEMELAIGWVLCAVLSHGMGFAFLQKQFPYIAKESYAFDLAFSLTVSLAGPINLLVVLAMHWEPKHGLKFF